MTKTQEIDYRNLPTGELGENLYWARRCGFLSIEHLITDELERRGYQRGEAWTRNPVAVMLDGEDPCWASH